MRLDRQQLDGGDAELAEVANCRLRGEARIRAANLLGNLLVEFRETLYVQFIDQRAMGRRFWLAVIAPREGFINHATEWGVGRAIEVVVRQICLLIAHLVAGKGISPVRRTGNRFGVWVEQHFVLIKAVSVLRLVQTVRAVAVDLARANVGQVDVPHHIGVFDEFDALGLFFVGGGVEQAEFDFGGVFAVERKIYAAAIPSGSKGIGSTGPGTHRQLLL